MLWVVRSDIGEWVFYAVSGAILLMLRIPILAAWLSAFPGKVKSFRKALTAKSAGL
ncbi:hypothetical protein D3C78_1985890 [compost metagenome]